MGSIIVVGPAAVPRRVGPPLTTVYSGSSTSHFCLSCRVIGMSVCVPRCRLHLQKRLHTCNATASVARLASNVVRNNAPMHAIDGLPLGSSPAKDRFLQVPGLAVQSDRQSCSGRRLSHQRGPPSPSRRESMYARIPNFQHGQTSAWQP